MAPEVLQRGFYSFEVDTWSIGCAMYTLLCGTTPFQTSTLRATYHRITTGTFSFPSNFSRNARSVISRLLNLRPAQRLTLDELLDHDFFTTGFSPAYLPPSVCFSKPTFPDVCVHRWLCGGGGCMMVAAMMVAFPRAFSMQFLCILLRVPSCIFHAPTTRAHSAKVSNHKHFLSYVFKRRSKSLVSHVSCGRQVFNYSYYYYLFTIIVK